MWRLKFESREDWMSLILSISYIAAAGVAAHFIGEALPRRRFDPRRFPFAPWPWEKSGRLYRALRVRAWKNKLPDMSRVAPDMVRKSVSLTGSAAAAERVAVETCVAEAVHWALMLLSFVIYLLYSQPPGAALAVLYGLSHVPFIIIQRYNRPTLTTLAERLKQREERIKHAHTDPLGQHR